MLGSTPNTSSSLLLHTFETLLQLSTPLPNPTTAFAPSPPPQAQPLPVPSQSQAASSNSQSSTGPSTPAAVPATPAPLTPEYITADRSNVAEHRGYGQLGLPSGPEDNRVACTQCRVQS
ncbi:hypothetical protein NLI96_g12116 [Meripilus lineatus]|uniref:Uncharacterized protein n=1 Tax=Meripilus lineatus TaxID=2056292 RepID=A0AAD5UQF7_9APHY|nr:hypothetical protein NLI96_g12116 [Physisporinus lineatus]